MQAAHERKLEEMRAVHRKEVVELEEQLAKARRASASDSADATEFRVDSLITSSVEQQKQQFIEFVLGALKGKDSVEYKQLYHFLLKCFTDSDNNFDGRVGFLEFEMLIEVAASLPRRFGYAPSTSELYKTDWDRLSARMSLFNALSSTTTGSKQGKAEAHWTSKDGFISFGTWLEYVLGHIKEKALQLKEVDKRSPWDSSKEEFRKFIIAATRSRASQEYKQFYYYVLKCFTDADADMDGRIDVLAFDSLIDTAAAAPRRWGFAPATSEMYDSEEEKIEARAKIFRSLDRDGTGYIEFDVWLQYIYKHICEKAGTLGEVGTVPAVLSASSATLRSSCPFRF